MSKRYLTVHMHDYQPPRENPHTGLVENQPSASPFHDWNERINWECYGPNGRSRIVDSATGTTIGLVNNYAYASFNIGPTLLTWMAVAAPDTLEAVIEGDRLSQERCSGHGNAIAQVFNHMIMPLAHDRDKKTQVRWGIEAFRHFFKRAPEGMHLAETAADVDTLEALAAEGIKFTVLAPRQAKRWRPLGSSDWQTGGVDPSRAYLCKLPSGRTINLFFYDGPVSQAVAFERLLDSGEKFLGRLKQGFSDSRSHNQLMHIAVDGETFGHHHRHGEMCMSWVFQNLLRPESDIKVTNYGEFLELNPPTWEAEIHAPSSWSCEHGVERWRNNCGCNSGANHGRWHQLWRKPLRDSLNHLRAQVDTLFDQKGRELFTDPWTARDEYIKVLLDDGAAAAWFEQHALPNVVTTAKSESKKDGYVESATFQRAINLMEMQRFGMYAFTSCAWFFDDIAGIEPVQNLRYAARVIELARLFTDEDYESRFVGELEQAPCNIAKYGNGKGVWDQLVRPLSVEGEMRTLLASRLDTPVLVRRLRQVVADARRLGVTFDETNVENYVLDAFAHSVPEGDETSELRQAYNALADDLAVARNLLGWKKAGRTPSRGTWQIPQLMSKPDVR